ncbi:MAG: flagellar hook-basal body complex protein FliE [Burkholderiales bacterium]|nr:flagellar hook-basal body complex protein FliE [Burkholderiales bacterium]
MDTSGIDSLLGRLAAAREALGVRDGLATRGAIAKNLAAPAAGGAVDFGELLRKGIAGVNESQQTAAVLGARFQSGDPSVGLEDTMIAVQKASLSFQQLVQVRNRVVAAYQDIMNMPI